MLNQYLNQEADRRLDPQKQREVIELAARLQELNRDHLTETELEQLAAEAGLEPEFVREAIRKLAPAPKAQEKPKQRVVSPPLPADGLWPEVTLSMVILLWGFVCASFGHRYDDAATPSLFFFAIPLSILVGYFGRYRGLAMVFGVFVGGATMMDRFGRTDLLSFLAAFAFYGLVAIGGHTARTRMQSKRGIADAPVTTQSFETDDRIERLERLRLLKAELEAEKTTRSFLSVDVVASVQAKAQLGELESKRVFGLYQRWIATTVSNFGGEVGSSAGDGAMAVFPNSLSALRCAKALQAGIASFNAQVGGNLHIRCGVSHGAVPWKPGTTIGSIHSPVIDRAAIRQKQAPPGGIAIGAELLSEAVHEYGGIQALPDTTDEHVYYGTVA